MMELADDKLESTNWKFSPNNSKHTDTVSVPSILFLETSNDSAK